MTPIPVESQYMTIFAQCFSPCGKYLVAANNYGKIAVFMIQNLVNPENSSIPNCDYSRPWLTFQAHEGPIYALTSTERFLISAGIGDILGWSWSDIDNKITESSWALPVHQNNGLGKPETNTIVIDDKDNGATLCSGGGDNKLYVWDVETRTPKTILEGHNDFVHCIALCNQNKRYVSSSEDGSVRIWDPRRSGQISFFEPYRYEKCCRAKYGKWIGSVAVDASEDWLVCGGGPSLSLWHFRSLSPTIIFDALKSNLNWCGFHEDLVIAGGGERYFYHFSYNGELKAKIPTSFSSTYSIIINDGFQNRVLAAAGTSYKIDVCNNFKYKDIVLSFV